MQYSELRLRIPTDSISIYLFDEWLTRFGCYSKKLIHEAANRKVDLVMDRPLVWRRRRVSSRTVYRCRTIRFLSKLSLTFVPRIKRRNDQSWWLPRTRGVTTIKLTPFLIIDTICGYDVMVMSSFTIQRKDIKEEPLLKRMTCDYRLTTYRRLRRENRKRQVCIWWYLSVTDVLPSRSR